MVTIFLLSTDWTYAREVTFRERGFLNTIKCTVPDSWTQEAYGDWLKLIHPQKYCSLGLAFCRLPKADNDPSFQAQVNTVNDAFFGDARRKLDLKEWREWKAKELTQVGAKKAVAFFYSFKNDFGQTAHAKVMYVRFDEWDFAQMIVLTYDDEITAGAKAELADVLKNITFAGASR
jgi:hypothetical protein